MVLKWCIMYNRHFTVFCSSVFFTSHSSLEWGHPLFYLPFIPLHLMSLIALYSFVQTDSDNVQGSLHQLHGCGLENKSHFQKVSFLIYFKFKPVSTSRMTNNLARSITVQIIFTSWLLLYFCHWSVHQEIPGFHCTAQQHLDMCSPHEHTDELSEW